MNMYPQSNSARSVRDLSGVWDFRFNANEPWQPIAVPASYNDQSPDPEFRRHYGMAYYRTTFTVPEGARRVLRFDAVTHNAVVRLNGQEIASHRRQRGRHGVLRLRQRGHSRRRGRQGAPAGSGHQPAEL